jgi:hypothetical protein
MVLFGFFPTIRGLFEDRLSYLHWQGAKGSIPGACHEGDIATLEQLLRKKGSSVAVNLETDKGVTPLAIAAAAGHLDVIAALLKAGANVNLTMKVGAFCRYCWRWCWRLASVATGPSGCASHNQHPLTHGPHHPPPLLSMSHLGPGRENGPILRQD